MANNGIGIAMNWANLFEINVTPGAGAKTWERVAGGITTANPETNEEVSQDAYYDGDGMSSSDVTGGQLTYSFEGHRKYGDPAQDYIAGLLLDYGEARKTDFRWTAPNGDRLEGECTIVEIVPQGGDANAKSDFSFGIHFNGQPTFTKGDASAFPASISAEAVSVAVGGTAQIEASVTPEGASPAVVFDTADDSIADVDAAGVVTGVSEGETTVVVKSAVRPMVRAEVKVTVTGGSQGPKLGVTAPTGGEIGWGDKTFEDLGILAPTVSGTKISLAGTLNHVEEWPEFSSNPADLTGYYAAMLLQGEGFIGKTMATNEWKVVDVADCADGWIMAVKKDQKSFTFQLFATREDAEAKTGGTQWTVDLNGVTYAE